MSTATTEQRRDDLWNTVALVALLAVMACIASASAVVAVASHLGDGQLETVVSLGGLLIAGGLVAVIVYLLVNPLHDPAPRISPSYASAASPANEYRTLAVFVASFITSIPGIILGAPGLTRDPAHRQTRAWAGGGGTGDRVRAAVPWCAVLGLDHHLGAQLMVQCQKGAASKVPLRMRNSSRRGWRIALNIATAVLLVTVTACSSPGKASSKPHDWTAAASSTDLLPTAAVSCPAVGYCITINALVAKEVTYKYGSWKVQTVPGSGELTAISCVTKSFCLTVGGNEYLKFDGSTWSAAQLVSTAAPTSLTSVSCVSTSFCMAVDIHSNSFVYDGTAWTSNPVAADGDRLDGVSCVSRQFCVTVGGNLIYNYNGTDWSVISDTLDGQPDLDAVSCSSPTSCLAVGQAHNDVDTGYEPASTARPGQAARWLASASWCRSAVPTPPSAPPRPATVASR